MINHSSPTLSILRHFQHIEIWLSDVVFICYVQGVSRTIVPVKGLTIKHHLIDNANIGKFESYEGTNATVSIGEQREFTVAGQVVHIKLAKVLWDDGEFEVLAFVNSGRRVFK